jgi:hypothetical protein
MPRQHPAITADTSNPIAMAPANAPLDPPTRQIAARPSSRPLEYGRSHASNPHRSQRRNRALFRPAISCLGGLRRRIWRGRGLVAASGRSAARALWRWCRRGWSWRGDRSGGCGVRQSDVQGDLVTSNLSLFYRHFLHCIVQPHLVESRSIPQKMWGLMWGARSVRVRRSDGYSNKEETS